MASIGRSPVQAEHVLNSWKEVFQALKGWLSGVGLQGDSLTISELIAVAQHKIHAHANNLPPQVISDINDSIQFLQESLDNGDSIYGVNTGFGGSANTSTTSTKDLQTSLLQMQLSAILPVFDDETKGSTSASFRDAVALSMPEDWVRGAILVRCNSLLRGHSGVRLDVINMMLRLLALDIIPLVPLRGSISASGDLCPLAYVASVLEGNPDVKVWTGSRDKREILPSNEALASAGLTPVSFNPKEVIGLLNGTAFSISAATIAHHQAETVLVFAQILTAMGVEALLGTIESFDPFIGEIRPHQGQIEVARNIRGFLRGSLLVRMSDEGQSYEGQLRQDRYALRTSSQWLGPAIEDIGLARRQIEVELNSTTDNPILNVRDEHILHGGNFQAASTTSSTEKARLALERVGKLLFAQSSELLDSGRCQGLPPNLAVDDPSLSYTMKGVDINMAAYMSELSYVANPVGTHVHSAEMSNQAINSLALVSARATMTAVDLVSHMSAAYLYSLCQALDLRVMNERFLVKLQPAITKLTLEILSEDLLATQMDDLHENIRAALLSSLASTTHKDSSDRFTIVAQAAQIHIVAAFKTRELTSKRFSKHSDVSLITTWTEKAAELMMQIFRSNREEYLTTPDPLPYLGLASGHMYVYVRNKLQIPIHRGLVDHPTLASGLVGRKRYNTGTYISRIYKALKDGDIAAPIMQCLEDALVEQKESFAPKL